MSGALRGFVLALGVAATSVAADEVPPFPNVTFTSLADGSTVTVESLRGRPVLITFWASWCGPCRVELPELQRLHEEYRDRGLALVAVNMDTSTAAARRFLETTKLQIPAYRMAQQEVAAIGVISLPTSVLLDPGGRPVELFEGYTPAMAGALRQLIEPMLAPPRGA